MAFVVLAAYASIATWGQFDSSDLMGYYNLLADGLLKGHLYVSDTKPWMDMDLVPFEGRYCLQWGPLPGVLHLIPKLFGAGLSDRVACILAGWLTCLVFLEIALLLRRQYFPALPRWVCWWFFFAFAFGTPTAIVALRGTIYHESIAVADLCVLAAFLAFLQYAGGLSSVWALLSGLAIGLALTSRVSEALYAPLLLAGMAALNRHFKRPLKTTAKHLAIFSLPVLCAGLLMVAYNQARFHSPWEYGIKYLPHPWANTQLYDWRRMPENFRHYVLAPIRLNHELPWISHIGWLPVVRVERAEDMSSLFLASPFVLLGVLAWKLFRSRRPEWGAARIFAITAAGSALAMLLSLLCYFWAARRYMQDFFLLLMVLAFVGVAAHAKNGVRWRRWQAPAWTIFAISALLHIHPSFFQAAASVPLDWNVTRTFVAASPLARRIAPGHDLDLQEAMNRNDLATLDLRQGRYGEALRQLQRADELMPGSHVIQKNLQLARALQAAAGRGN